MRLRETVAVVVLLPGLVVLTGCPGGFAAPATGGDVTPFNIPEGRSVRPPLPPDLASMVYPEPDQIPRDPFLSTLEEGLADGKDISALEPPKPVEKEAGPRRIRIPAPPKPIVIKQLHDEVKGIFLGKHNTFEFHGKLYEEGDVVEKSDWVVVSITEAGIRLRTKDGAGSDFLAFRVASISFEFNNGPTKPKKDSKPAQPSQSANKQ